MNSMYVIGADMTLARLRNAIETLGGLGKKKQKKLEEVNRALPDFLSAEWCDLIADCRLGWAMAKPNFNPFVMKMG